MDCNSNQISDVGLTVINGEEGSGVVLVFMSAWYILGQEVQRLVSAMARHLLTSNHLQQREKNGLQVFRCICSGTDDKERLDVPVCSTEEKYQQQHSLSHTARDEDSVSPKTKASSFPYSLASPPVSESLTHWKKLQVASAISSLSTAMMLHILSTPTMCTMAMACWGEQKETYRWAP